MCVCCFLYFEMITGVPSGDLEEHRFVEAAEAEGRQVVAIPIATASRPAVHSIAQYYGLTCNCTYHHYHVQRFPLNK
jgi:hypothetical protein